MLRPLHYVKSNGVRWIKQFNYNINIHIVILNVIYIIN